MQWPELQKYFTTTEDGRLIDFNEIKQLVGRDWTPLTFYMRFGQVINIEKLEFLIQHSDLSIKTQNETALFHYSNFLMRSVPEYDISEEVLTYFVQKSAIKGKYSINIFANFIERGPLTYSNEKYLKQAIEIHKRIKETDIIKAQQTDIFFQENYKNFIKAKAIFEIKEQKKLLEHCVIVNEKKINTNTGSKNFKI